MNRKILLFAVTALFCNAAVNAQGVAVNTTGAAADNSAMLDVNSTTQGVLVPRMLSSQRTAISNAATGLLVYQTDGTAGFYFYNGTAWVSLSGGAPTGVAGGNLGGNYPNPSIASLPAISGASLTSLTPANLAANGTLPAENGSALTNLNATNLTSGTVPGGRMPALTGGDVTSSAGSVVTTIANNTTSGNDIVAAIGSANTVIPTARLGTGSGTATTYLNGSGAFTAATASVNVVHTPATYTLLSTDNVVVYDGTATAATFTLPLTTLVGTGKTYYLVNDGTASPYQTSLLLTSPDKISDLANGGYTTAGYTPTNPYWTQIIVVSDGAGKWIIVSKD